jgi:hypothetical protein
MDSITFERGQGCNAGNAANLDGISHDRPWLGASVWSGPARWRPRRGRRRVLNYGRCERGRGPSLACCFVVVVVPVLEWRGSRCGEGLGCRDRWKGGLAARNLTLKLPERGWVGCAVCARPSAVRACVPAAVAGGVVPEAVVCLGKPWGLAVMHGAWRAAAARCWLGATHSAPPPQLPPFFEHWLNARFAPGRGPHPFDALYAFPPSSGDAGVLDIL